MPRASCIVFILTLSLVLGCGPDTGGRVAVSGTITQNGQPLESGTIEFTAVDASLMSGATIRAGKYEIPAAQGLLPGKYIVRVSAIKEAEAIQGPPGETTIAEDQNQELIPVEFNVDSTLTVEITGGSANTYDLAIP